MNIKILSLRRTDSAAVLSLEDEYLKRLRKYATIDIIDIKRAKIKAHRGQRVGGDTDKVLASIKRDDFIILLSEQGREFSSPEFAHFIKQKMNSGLRTLTFILGGPLGVAAEVEQSSHLKLSLSRLTLPHRLARLFLIETLYRAFDMLHGGPYHK